jgi:hypothetical protein
VLALSRVDRLNGPSDQHENIEAGVVSQHGIRMRGVGVEGRNPREDTQNRRT